MGIIAVAGPRFPSLLKALLKFTAYNSIIRAVHYLQEHL
jgi:hypothetical protein